MSISFSNEQWFALSVCKQGSGVGGTLIDIFVVIDPSKYDHG